MRDLTKDETASLMTEIRKAELAQAEAAAVVAGARAILTRAKIACGVPLECVPRADGKWQLGDKVLVTPPAESTADGQAAAESAAPAAGRAGPSDMTAARLTRSGRPRPEIIR